MSDDLNVAARELGQKGGKATLKKHGKKYFKELSQKAALARQNKAS